jgi:hypothetical protein
MPKCKVIDRSLWLTKWWDRSKIMKNEEVSRTMKCSSKATDAWEVDTKKNKNKMHVTYKLTTNWRKLITRMTELPGGMKRPRSRGETSKSWMKAQAEILIKREWKEVQTRNLMQNLFWIKSKVRKWKSRGMKNAVFELQKYDPVENHLYDRWMETILLFQNLKNRWLE